LHYLVPWGDSNTRPAAEKAREVKDTSLRVPHGECNPNGAQPVIDIIRNEARACLAAGSHVNLENKVVLAIAIRLAAEEFMVNKINDAAFVAGIGANQTQALVKKFKEPKGRLRFFMPDQFKNLCQHRNTVGVRRLQKGVDVRLVLRLAQARGRILDDPAVLFAAGTLLAGLCGLWFVFDRHFRIRRPRR
jgi:hypothetical protein